jgi:hypothetical protein
VWTREAAALCRKGMGSDALGRIEAVAAVFDVSRRKLNKESLKGLTILHLVP